MTIGKLACGCMVDDNNIVTRKCNDSSCPNRIGWDALNSHRISPVTVILTIIIILAIVAYKILN